MSEARIAVRVPTARVVAARGPLAGQRVLVTRDEPRRGPLSRALARRGARVHLWPAYRIRPVMAARMRRWAAALGGFDWLVFTSVHAVAAVAAWGAPRVLGSGPRPRVAVVGAATASAARAAGWRIACKAKGEGAAALATMLRARGVAGRRVAFPASERALPGLSRRLRALQAEVEQVVAYRVRWNRQGRGALRRGCARGFDALAFTSPGGIEGLRQALGLARLRALLAATPSVALGATTRRALAAHTRRPVQVATRASLESTAAAVVVAVRAARRPADSSRNTGPRSPR